MSIKESVARLEATSDPASSASFFLVAPLFFSLFDCFNVDKGSDHTQK
jgi:hypothetical protein